MEFRLFGSLEVVVDGKPFEFRSNRQRIILAMLLFQAGHLVPLSRLVDAVWDETPPATAKSQIQTCVSALRRQLGQLGADQLISTHSVGYAINVPGPTLDVANFERLTSRGRVAAADNRPEDAVQDLRAALALWRGPAAEDVPSRLVQAMASRLNEDHLGVLEQCIELELSLGRHHELVGELSELVKQYPLREFLRAQHMLALYRSARQAEALESFHEVRLILTDELGLEPGERLCALQRAILAKDPALDPRPDVDRGVAWAKHGTAVVPRQLPAAIADFTGRRKIRRDLIGLLSAADEPEGSRYLPIAILSGKGGVGKTALALNVAHAVRAVYPDGQLFVQLQDTDGQPISSMELLARFLRGLGLPPIAIPDQPAERMEVYRSWLGDRRVLIVLDDAHSVDKIVALIPGSPNCGVIITSRNPLAGLPGAQHFQIDDLDERTSVELLAKVIGPERVRAEASAALTLVRLCGCLPLALRIVGAKVAARQHWKVDQMVRRMTDEGRRLDELALGGIGIRATLATSYKGLSLQAQRLFLRLGLLGSSDFAAWVSAPLLNMDVEAAGDLLEELVEAGLVEVRRSDDAACRYHLHELIRIFALERLAAEEPLAGRANALERLLACWLALAGEAHRRAYGGDYSVLHGSAAGWTLPPDIQDQLLMSPLAWFRIEGAGLVSAVAQAAQAGLDELCWDLAVTLVTLFESEYQVDEWQKTHELALEATRRAGNTRGEAAVLYSLGHLAVSRQVGDATRYLEPALRAFDQLGDAHGSALALGALAFVDRLAGRYEVAMTRYQEALAGYREAGDCVGEVDALTNMAQIQMDRENYEDVQKLFDQAFVRCRSLKAPRIIAQTEHRLAEFLLRLGDLERAERSFRYVLQLTRAAGDLVGETYALEGLGIVHTRQGSYEMAESDLSAALNLSRHMSANLLHGRILMAVAELCLAKEELDRATALSREALVVFSEIGPAAVWLARFLELKARIDERVGNPAAASSARQQALDLAGESDPALTRVLVMAIGAAAAGPLPQADGR